MTVITAERIIFGRSRCTFVNTLSSSMKISAVKVMLTMFTKESWKKTIEKSIITEP